MGEKFVKMNIIVGCAVILVVEEMDANGPSKCEWKWRVYVKIGECIICLPQRNVLEW